jgi:gluconolactonase
VNESTYDVVRSEFRSYIAGTGQLERLWTGGRWLEGPAYFCDAGILVFSDIPNNRMLRWSEDLNGSGSITVFRQPSNYANGNTIDQSGRLVTCEHGMRRVTRTEKNGTVTVVADQLDDARLNSPNDVVVKSDGTIWFTDPDYGIRNDYEGHRAESEVDGDYVYRVNSDGSGLVVVATQFTKPNGLAFSPDEHILYISDTGVPPGPTDGTKAHITRFQVGSDNSLSDAEPFVSLDNGKSDGFRLDEQGNIWTSAADGVHCISPDGELIGKVHIPEKVANVCFGGPKFNRLYVTATSSLYAIYLGVRGCV